MAEAHDVRDLPRSQPPNSNNVQGVLYVKKSKNHHGYDSEKHEKKLQDKLKRKEWDPINEILEIMDEYEEGVPKRDPDYNHWGD